MEEDFFESVERNTAEFLEGVRDRKIGQAEIFTFAEGYGEIALNLAGEWRLHPDVFYRSTAAFLYAKANGFDAFEALLRLSKDPDKDVRNDALISMGMSKDSRFFLVLVKKLFECSNGEERDLLYLALSEKKDPRILTLTESEEFRKYMPYPLFANTLEKISGDYEYTFMGSKDMLEAAKSSNTPLLKGKDIKEGLERIVEMGSDVYPNTFVILPDRRFYIGNPRTEHVNVARGRKVLCAGEVVFSRRDNGLRVAYINNRSNGYHPSALAEIHLPQALNEVVAKPPKKFSEVFPERGYFDIDFLSQFSW